MIRTLVGIMFVCMAMACRVDTRDVDRTPTADQTVEVSTSTADQTVEVSTPTAEFTGPAEQVCLSQCLQDCGAICSIGSGKAACIAQCRADNAECKAYC